MYSFLKIAVMVCAVLGLSVSSASAGVTAFFSYATWCLPCKVLEPKLESALETVGADDVELIYLDFTEMSVENLDRQFERAEPLSPEDFLQGRFVKTGFAYVLADDALVGEITSDMTVEEIIELLTHALEY